MSYLLHYISPSVTIFNTYHEEEDGGETTFISLKFVAKIIDQGHNLSYQVERVLLDLDGRVMDLINMYELNDVYSRDNNMG
jgi:hypothetical protein